MPDGKVSVDGFICVFDVSCNYLYKLMTLIMVVPQGELGSKQDAWETSWDKCSDSEQSSQIKKAGGACDN